VTGVDIDELGPGVLAAQVGGTSPAGTQHVTADPGSALALAAALEVHVRVADTMMDRLAVGLRPGQVSILLLGRVAIGDIAVTFVNVALRGPADG
jgi:hypothetical protein